MSWGQWPGVPGVLNPSQHVISPTITTTPQANPLVSQYTQEQWAQMQQQNWQQWAQWQQQYQQWHQQYGAEYQKSLNAMNSTQAQTQTQKPSNAVSLPNLGVPPPLPSSETKQNPPPPPPAESFNKFTVNDSTAALGRKSWPPNNYSEAGGNLNALGKRPFEQQAQSYDSKRGKFEQNWQTKPGWGAQPNFSQPPPNLAKDKSTTSNEEMTETEKKFEKQFAEWEAQFNKWKEQNANHPDKAQYKEYEKKWEAWRKQLLERREQMKRKRLGLTADISLKDTMQTQTQPVDKPEITINKTGGGLLPTPISKDNVEQPSPSTSLLSESLVSGFLNTSTSDGIPGLDLVHESVDTKSEQQEEQNVDDKNEPDYEALSKGIKSILGDEKLLSMLSKVTQQTYKPPNPASLINNDVDEDKSEKNEYQNRFGSSPFNKNAAAAAVALERFDSPHQPMITSTPRFNKSSNSRNQNIGGNQGFYSSDSRRSFGNDGPPNMRPVGDKNEVQSSSFSKFIDGKQSITGKFTRYENYNEEDDLNNDPFAYENEETNQSNFNKRNFGFDNRNPGGYAANRNANFDGRNPNFDNKNPNFDNRNPNFDNRNPNFDNRNPNFDNRNASFDNRNPNFDSRNPNFDNRNANFDNRNPSFDNRNQNFDNRNPNFDNRNPNFDSRNANFAANFGERNPNFAERQFNFDLNSRPPQKFDDRPQQNFDDRVPNFDTLNVNQAGNNFRRTPGGFPRPFTKFDNNRAEFERIQPDTPRRIEFNNSNQQQGLNSVVDVSTEGGGDIWKPQEVIDYNHKPLKKDDFEVSVEPIQMFDYRHKPVNRIPYPDRPTWIAKILCQFHEFNPIIGRIDRYPVTNDRYDTWRSTRDVVTSYRRYEDRRPDRKYENNSTTKDNSRDSNNKKFYERSADHNPTTDSNLTQQIDKGNSYNTKPQEVILVEDLLCPPGRFNRPSRIVIILRGPPGSGKTFLAKLIKDKEVENGGSPPRILSLDDYFMVEQEKEIVEDGKTVKVKEMVYEYEEEMEASYRTSLLKSFKKTITDGYFPFIIVDNVNDKVKYFGEMWSFAKQNGFQVYVCQLELDLQSCSKRNIHGRTEGDIEKCIKGWEPTLQHYSVLDATSLLQSGSIAEVEMEEISSPPEEEEMDDEEEKEENTTKSKWDTFDCSFQSLAKLDGVNKPLRASKTMDEYLQLDDQCVSKETKPGQKRVRWADLEERKEQEKMRAIGFVVGQTNWDRMMDPTKGSGALTQTKYIERVGRYDNQ